MDQFMIREEALVKMMAAIRDMETGMYPTLFQKISLYMPSADTFLHCLLAAGLLQTFWHYGLAPLLFKKKKKHPICSDEPSLYCAIDIDHEQASHPSDAKKLSDWLPRLNHSDGYYTEPGLQQLLGRELAEPGYCRRVRDFVVGRTGFGRIKFLGETDVVGLDIGAIVRLDEREVEVYPEENQRPPEGEGLNKPAEVSLLNVVCLDGTSGKKCTSGIQLKQFVEKLKKETEAQGAKFVWFDPVAGEWTFQVMHFSRYGLDFGELVPVCSSSPPPCEHNVDQAILLQGSFSPCFRTTNIDAVLLHCFLEVPVKLSWPCIRTHGTNLEDILRFLEVPIGYSSWPSLSLPAFSPCLRTHGTEQLHDLEAILLRFSEPSWSSPMLVPSLGTRRTNQQCFAQHCLLIKCFNFSTGTDETEQQHLCDEAEAVSCLLEPLLVKWSPSSAFSTSLGTEQDEQDKAKAATHRSLQGLIKLYCWPSLSLREHENEQLDLKAVHCFLEKSFYSCWPLWSLLASRTEQLHQSYEAQGILCFLEVPVDYFVRAFSSSIRTHRTTSKLHCFASSRCHYQQSLAPSLGGQLRFVLGCFDLFYPSLSSTPFSTEEQHDLGDQAEALEASPAFSPSLGTKQDDPCEEKTAALCFLQGLICILEGPLKLFYSWRPPWSSPASGTQQHHFYEAAIRSSFKALVKSFYCRWLPSTLPSSLGIHGTEKQHDFCVAEASHCLSSRETVILSVFLDERYRATCTLLTRLAVVLLATMSSTIL